MLATTPRISGRGKVSTTLGADPYAALLARARHDYLCQTRGSAQLTAKHGRHAVSTVLAAVLPTLVTSGLALPSWTTAGVAPKLELASVTGDARLLSTSTVLPAVTQFTRLALLWQRQCTSRASGHLTSLPVRLGGTTLLAHAGASAAPVNAGTHAWPMQVDTQNLRASQAVSLVGNRLHRIHRHLATLERGLAVNPLASLTAEFVRRHLGLLSGMSASAPSLTVLTSPICKSNVWANLFMRQLALANTETWDVGAGAVRPLGAAGSAAAEASSQVGLLTPATHPLGHLLAAQPRPTLGLFGWAQPDYLLIQPSGATAARRSWFLELRGGEISALGGVDRRLGEADSFANIAASAAELQNMRAAQRAGLTALSRVALAAQSSAPQLASEACVAPSYSAALTARDGGLPILDTGTRLGAGAERLTRAGQSAAFAAVGARSGSAEYAGGRPPLAACLGLVTPASLALTSITLEWGVGLAMWVGFPLTHVSTQTQGSSLAWGGCVGSVCELSPYSLFESLTAPVAGAATAGSSWQLGFPAAAALSSLHR